MSDLKQESVGTPSEVRVAYVEPDGSIGVKKK